jgi:CheY-like chemotaxis protein
MSSTAPFSAALGHVPLALLVDRDPDTRRMYAQYLQLSACDVDEAEDGREALAKAIARHPDVVVTETRLPGINGFDLCQLLRRDPSTTKISIVFVTGDAFEADLRRAERSGADAVLIKPCLPDKLIAEIRRVLRQSAELRMRGTTTRAKFAEQAERSQVLIGRAHGNMRRVMLSRAHKRADTTEPPTVPPALICPECDLPLKYLHSHVGGVSARHPEQWDYFECTAGCGTFQYRERTRKLRKV